MRGAMLAILLLLAACSGGRGDIRNTLNGTQPGLDVADAALRAGSPQIALQTADAILAKSPGNSAALLVRGDALTSLGRFEEAADAYTRVLQAAPGSVGARVGLGRIRLASDPAAAEALFLEALNRDPRNTIALTDMGIARDLQGRHADAQDAYRQALGIDPELRAAQVNLALSLAMSGDGAGAVRLIRPLAEAPSANRKLRHDYAAVLAMSGDRPQAERILSADLSPTETRQALDAYAAKPAATLLAAAPASTAPASTAAPRPGAMAPEPPGGFQVQLSAAMSEDAANVEWQHLQEKLPEAMNGHRPTIDRVDQGGKVFWRLRTGGFHTPADARGFCDQVRAAGGTCVVGGA
jgi:Flp pilus assembly protein TadD